MNELFDEILSCKNCPQVEVITDENETIVKDHLANTHSGISVIAGFISK